MSVTIQRHPGTGAPILGTTVAQGKVSAPLVSTPLPLINLDGVDPQTLSGMQAALAPVVAQPNAEASATLPSETHEVFASLAAQLAPPPKGAAIAKAFDRTEQAKDAVFTLGKQIAFTTRATQIVANEPSFPAQIVAGQAAVQSTIVMKRALSQKSGAAPAPAVRKAAQTIVASATSDSDPLSGNPADLEKKLNAAFAAGTLPPGMTVDELVEAVMFEAGQQTDSETRDFVAQMQVTLQKKQALNDLKSQYATAQNALTEKMQDEYNTMVTAGTINPQTEPFTSYQTWRQVSWSDPTQNADGSYTLATPSLAAPSPPAVPLWMSQGPANSSLNGPAPITSTIDTNTIGAGAFGLPDSVYSALSAIFTQLHAAGATTQTTVDGWLTADVQLKSPPQSSTDALANLNAVTPYLTGTMNTMLGSATKANAAGSTAFANLFLPTISTALGDINGVVDSIFTVDMVVNETAGFAGFAQMINSGQSGLDIAAANGTAAQTADVTAINNLAAQLSPSNIYYLSPDDRKTLQDKLQAIVDACAPLSRTQTTISWNQAYLDWLNDPNHKNPAPPETVSKTSTAMLTPDTAGLKTAATNLLTLLNNYPPPANLQQLYGAPGLVAELPPDTTAITNAVSAAQSDMTGPFSAHAQVVKLQANITAMLNASPSLLTPQQKTDLQTFVTAQNTTPPPPDSAYLTAAMQLFATADFRDAAQVDPLKTAILGGDPATDVTADHLSNRLLGATLVQPESADEASLVSTGAVDDPALLAKMQQQTVAADVQSDKNAAISAAYAANPNQTAQPGDNSCGLIAAFNNAESDVGNQIDSLDSMSSIQQAQLQMQMDNRSKFYETLSNILKTVSDSANNIIANIKGS